MLDRLFRRFEAMIDPYADYVDADVPPTRLWPFLRSYLMPARRVLAWITLLTLLVAAAEIGLIFYAGRVVDLLSGAERTDVWAAHGLELAAIAAFILLIKPVLSLIDGLLLNQSLMPNIGTLVRWRAHRHVLRQSVGWFQNDFAGRIANRLMQTAPATGETVYQVFDALVYATIYIVGAAVLLAGADPRLILPMILWFTAYLALAGWLIPRVTRASKAFSDARSAITGRIVDSYTNIASVKLFAHTRAEEDYAGEAIETARQAFARQMRLITLMEFWLNLINGFLIVGVVGYAIVLWQSGAATVGTIAAASALTLRLNAMTGWIMWALSSFFENLGVVSEGMETIAQPVTLLDAHGAKPLEVATGAIAIREVSHHYGKASGGLDRVSLTIAPGEKIGLVGRSGAGKSTLVNLMLRFFDHEKGRIEIDEQDICAVTQDSLRASIGMVTQDTALMHRSVLDNIRYGRPGASAAEVEAAARKAEAHEFILDLEDPEGNTGYGAKVGERGVKLSGGQRQRIALARVILKNAPILVLDEATSALDSEIEAAILDTLYGVMEGKTVIAIAHRLSTIAQMDRIVVMEDGRVVESGSHAELLDHGGAYAKFWARQSGGFIGTEEAETEAAE